MILYRQPECRDFDGLVADEVQRECGIQINVVDKAVFSDQILEFFIQVMFDGTEYFFVCRGFLSSEVITPDTAPYLPEVYFVR